MKKKTINKKRGPKNSKKIKNPIIKDEIEKKTKDKKKPKNFYYIINSTINPIFKCKIK
jgi:hypothetical protein